MKQFRLNRSRTPRTPDEPTQSVASDIVNEVATQLKAKLAASVAINDRISKEESNYIFDLYEDLIQRLDTQGIVLRRVVRKSCGGCMSAQFSNIRANLKALFDHGKI